MKNSINVPNAPECLFWLAVRQVVDQYGGYHSNMNSQSPPGINSAQRRIHAAALRLFAERDVTHISVSDLAAEAGVARSTIYNNLGDSAPLFDEVAAQLIHEMGARLSEVLEPLDDVALRLAFGVRLYLRRAYEEPLWGRFMNRFALSSAPLYALLASDVTRHLVEGIERGRYKLGSGQVPAAVVTIAGSVVAAMQLILEGHQTWRALGSETAELLLVAFGISQAEAKELANRPLPVLPVLEAKSLSSVPI